MFFHVKHDCFIKELNISYVIYVKYDKNEIIYEDII